MLPPSVALRKEDAELDDPLDALTIEADVRRDVEDFNERVIAARYRLPEGPPLVTMPRDVDETVAAWRRAAYGADSPAAAQARERRADRVAEPPPKRALVAPLKFTGLTCQIGHTGATTEPLLRSAA